MKGKIWKFGDNVDTDQIIPAEYLISSNNEFLGSKAFIKARPDFSPSQGDIIVAGENFGCGSSREHAVKALQGAGISCVIAKSFARIFYRNSINLGLPVIELDLNIKEGDILEVDTNQGMVRSKENEWTFKPYPPFIKNIMDKGLIDFVKERLNR